MELKAADYRRALAMINHCVGATESPYFRSAVLDALSTHLGYEHLTFFLGRHPSLQLELSEPRTHGIVPELMARYLDSYAGRDVFAHKLAREMMQEYGQAVLPQLAELALSNDRCGEFLKDFLPGNDISDKILLWLDTSLPVHGYIGVVATGGHTFNCGDHELLRELRPALSHLLRSHLEHQAAPVGMTLSIREHEIARYVADGWPNRLIARELGISEWTVKRHITHVLAKCGARSRTELAIMWWPGKRGTYATELS
ncbi:helix-turn-helix domain-containing protein [Candidatus Protofrankia californiensis]|uniref:helix-turn-helix domain-containing protein n=1 Tax=Candidatus Protofrankia californiensis TaxID=1839754 RepID=UPI001040E7B2|nr:helix-turn-helix transcriptional regulator [Candidatus Protofrankia californiensis]